MHSNQGECPKKPFIYRVSWKYEASITFNQGVRGSSPRCLIKIEVAESQKSRLSATFCV